MACGRVTRCVICMNTDRMRLAALLVESGGMKLRLVHNSVLFCVQRGQFIETVRAVRGLFYV